MDKSADDLFNMWKEVTDRAAKLHLDFLQEQGKAQVAIANLNQAKELLVRCVAQLTRKADSQSQGLIDEISELDWL